MKTQIIQNGVVVNTIVASVIEAQAAFPEATCIEATAGGIGWLWDGETLTAPPAMPQSRRSKSPRQQATLLTGMKSARAAWLALSLP